MQTQHPDMATAGNMPLKMHPGGGAGKAAEKAKSWLDQPFVEKQPVAAIYCKPSPGEKGTVDASKVAALKAKAKRPSALKRTSKIKLDKEEKKELKAKRKEAAKKFSERSAETKKELSYMKNARVRQTKREKAQKKAQKTPKKSTNMTLMYSVGPQPKYKAISRKFRAYRKFAAKQISCAKDKAPMFTTIYKVGSPAVKSS